MSRDIFAELMEGLVWLKKQREGVRMDIQKHYDSVERFNDIAGNLSNVTVEKMEAQMKVVVEEIKELQDALDNKDAVGMLDGVCDSFVTLMGLIQQMKEVGFEVDWALGRVCENNLEKFVDDVDAADLVTYRNNGWELCPNLDHHVIVLKDQNGKIRKPVGFMPVEISDLVPGDFA